jgi:diaminopimelate epimerase
MTLQFFKFQATGNDFIIIDDRQKQFDTKNSALIQKLCNRRFGIGGDGLILFRNEPELDFRMIYFNADGYEGSMCGNGGRCAAAFAHKLNPGKYDFRFQAYDGLHEASIEEIGEHQVWVRLSMQPVQSPEIIENDLFLNTGSPHFVRFVEDAASIDVNAEGRKVRNSERFLRDGVNVNFAEIHPDSITVRTYERGVEEETLSCGTGVTASAIASHFSGMLKENPIRVYTRGGELKVHFSMGEDNYTAVTLSGPAAEVFTGTIEI